MNTDRIKQALGKPMWFDRWIYRAQQIVLIGFVTVVAIGLALSAGDQQWPYDVMERRLLTPKVEPGESVVMHRLIDYHEVDCWRSYDRRVVSRTAEGRMYRFTKIVEERLPVELTNKSQSWAAPLPIDFPCGPAYLVETVTAACTWWQRHMRPLRKPDIITPFEVVGCPPG